jgi:cytochrome c-type protein NapC
MSEDKSKGMLGRLRAAGFGGIVIVFAAGIIFWGGFNWAVEATNTERFCLSCHEMENFVYQEYRNTIHYQNRTGVRAVCSDCHVPDEWGPKMVRKVQASRELYGKIVGSINTPEKFAANRLRLAEREWKRMKANDSRECRNCHSFEYFDYTAQGRRSNNAHQTGLAEGKTCIDCHKGIAHSLPPIHQDIGIGHDGAVPPEVFRPQ